MTDRILEIGGYSAGFCGRLFAQNGHEVTRVESAPAPAWASQQAMSLFLHGDKRRVQAKPEQLTELASQVDVVIVEAETADAANALGFNGWSTPVKVVITPFGLTGPKRIGVLRQVHCSPWVAIVSLLAMRAGRRCRCLGTMWNSRAGNLRIPRRMVVASLVSRMLSTSVCTSHCWR